MRTTTEEKTAASQAKRTKPILYPDNPMLTIADTSVLRFALDQMFHAYVWTCTGRDEEDHENICFVYHNLLTLLDFSPETIGCQNAVT